MGLDGVGMIGGIGVGVLGAGVMGFVGIVVNFGG